tara:strand:+ start:47 stop:1036 length:990 start_codon:yes stop_codon:yes gene_type:complete
MEIKDKEIKDNKKKGKQLKKEKKDMKMKYLDLKKKRDNKKKELLVEDINNYYYKVKSKYSKLFKVLEAIKNRVDRDDWDYYDILEEFYGLKDAYITLNNLKVNQKKVKTKKPQPTKEYVFRDGKMALTKKQVAHLKKKGCIEEDFEDFKIAKINKKLKDFNENKGSNSGGNKDRDLDFVDTHADTGWSMCPYLYYWEEATDLSGNMYWTDEGSFKGKSYKPSWAEVIKYRDDVKDIKKTLLKGGGGGNKNWNGATSRLGNNKDVNCRRLKAFKEAKVLIEYGETIPRKSIKAWGNADTLEDLIVNYKLDRDDLLDKRKGHPLIEAVQLL